MYVVQLHCLPVHSEVEVEADKFDACHWPQESGHPDIVDPEKSWSLDFKGLQQSAYSSWGCDVAPAN